MILDDAITLFLLYFLVYLFLRNSAKVQIHDIGINLKYFPKYYIVPKSFIRKIFNLKKKAIPKFLNFRLYASFVFLILGVFVAIISCFFNDNNYVIGVIWFIPVCFGLLDTIVFFSFSHFFKKEKKRKRKSKNHSNNTGDGSVC